MWQTSLHISIMFSIFWTFSVYGSGCKISHRRSDRQPAEAALRVLELRGNALMQVGLKPPQRRAFSSVFFSVSLLDPITSINISIQLKITVREGMTLFANLFASTSLRRSKRGVTGFSSYYLEITKVVSSKKLSRSFFFFSFFLLMITAENSERNRVVNWRLKGRVNEYESDSRT